MATKKNRNPITVQEMARAAREAGLKGFQASPVLCPGRASSFCTLHPSCNGQVGHLGACPVSLFPGPLPYALDTEV